MAKYKQIKINVTPEHYDELIVLSSKESVSIASYIRKILNIDLKDPPQHTISNSNIVIHKEDTLLIYHLKKIGTNINQIASAINSKNYYSKNILIELIKIQKELHDYKC